MAATLIVALTLTVGSLLALDRFRVSLRNDQRNAALASAVGLENLALAGRLPAVLVLTDQNSAFAQVINQRGRVIAASSNIVGEPPVGPPVGPHTHFSVRNVSGSVVGQNGSLSLLALPARIGHSTLTVYTAYSLRTSDVASHDFGVALLVGVPLLLVMVAGTTWLIVGRALHPIDAIRDEVADITTQDLSRRVSVPRGEDELVRLARTMNLMLARLEASLLRQRNFVADASHELRSPLASLRAQLEIGLSLGEAADWPATATDALADEARLERLITDLLLLARSENVPPPNRGARPTVDLRRLVEEEVASRRPSRNVRLRTDATTSHVISVEATLASRIVKNLLDNAQRYARRDVLVSVEASDQHMIDLSVTDDGPGIAHADRERVFERFTRLDASRNAEEGGAGLGLAIVREIVEQYGGTIAFVDVPIGARVVVRLPRSNSEPTIT